MVFKFVRKTIFEQTYNFFNYLVLLSLDIIKVYNKKVILFGFVFLIMLHIQTLTPLILLSVNFGLPGENLVTSFIWSAIKGQKMEEAFKVGHKKLRKNFRGWRISFGAEI